MCCSQRLLQHLRIAQGQQSGNSAVSSVWVLQSRNPKIVSLILTCHISVILILGFLVYSRRLATLLTAWPMLLETSGVRSSSGYCWM